MIKRILSMLGGAIAGVVMVFIITWLLGTVFGPLYQNDDDMNRNVLIYLVASGVFMLLGAIAGNFIYCRLSKR